MCAYARIVSMHAVLLSLSEIALFNSGLAAPSPQDKACNFMISAHASAGHLLKLNSASLDLVIKH
jgi:hypothetical protein